MYRFPFLVPILIFILDGCSVFSQHTERQGSFINGIDDITVEAQQQTNGRGNGFTSRVGQGEMKRSAISLILGLNSFRKGVRENIQDFLRCTEGTGIVQWLSLRRCYKGEEHERS